MVISLKKHFATEKHDLEWSLKEIPKRKEHVRVILERIIGLVELTKDAKLLEIGAAQGLSIIAFKDLEYDCIGIEPWDGAIDVSKQLAIKMNMVVEIKKGTPIIGITLGPFSIK